MDDFHTSKSNLIARRNGYARIRGPYSVFGLMSYLRVYYIKLNVYLATVCPISSVPFHTVSYFINRVSAAWIYSIYKNINGCYVNVLN